MILISSVLYADEMLDHTMNCRYIEPETVKEFINIGTSKTDIGRGLLLKN